MLSFAILVLVVLLLLWGCAVSLSYAPPVLPSPGLSELALSCGASSASDSAGVCVVVFSAAGPAGWRGAWAAGASFVALCCFGYGVAVWRGYSSVCVRVGASVPGARVRRGFVPLSLFPFWVPFPRGCEVAS